jgi:hypothetical protein
MKKTSTKIGRWGIVLLFSIIITAGSATARTEFISIGTVGHNFS